MAAYGRLTAVSMSILAAGALLLVLFYGRGFLVPLVIGLLLAGVISSAVTRMESIGFPTWLAMTCAIGAGILALGAFVLIFATQGDAFAVAWPKYAARLESLIASLTAISVPDLTAKMTESLKLSDLSGPLSWIASSTGSLLGSIGLVAMYAAFLLAERGVLTSKFGYLVADTQRTAELERVFESVAHGIRSYLWIKTITSLLTGGLCYLILWVYGVDFAAIWGALIFLLNFIPTIGSIIAEVIPSLVALVQFDTVWPTVQVAVLMTIVQFVIGNVIEPKYIGHTLNLSPFVVIVSLTFWGTIWGIEGAFLSVPITASFAIICNNLPAWRWVAVLLSSDGRLSEAP
jgi:AI-2 transport protein TqsA